MTDRPEDTEQAERRRAARRQGQAYQAAAEAVFAILVAAGVGYWVDQRFDTTPRYLLIGMAVGFASFAMRLVRLGKQLHGRTREPEGTKSREES
jgi:F0F1-type ATP synthase assembly protein I